MNAAALAGLLLLATSAASAADLSRLARQIGEAARTAGLQRVAVSRLEPARGGNDSRGAGLTERLTVALVRGGRVQAVERSLLPQVADEIALGRTGAVSGGTHRNVRLAPVDGVVIGRYTRDGRRLRVFARIVQLETGVIVGAADAEIEDEEFDSDPTDVPVPVLGGSFPATGEELRDAPSEAHSCLDAAERINRLQGEVLELKARYWGFRLRLGLNGGDVSVNPGSTIPDADLRARFYTRLKEVVSAEHPVPMTEEQLRRLADAEGRSYTLVRDCGL